MEGPPPDSDEQFAEWYVWAKREVSSDRRVCLGVAQAAVDAQSSGADRADTEAAARRSVAGTAVVLLPKISPWRQGYAQWYDWARLEFGGDSARLHRLTRVAIERLKTDGDAGRAAEAARAAAAADPPATGSDASSGTGAGSWTQGGSATTGGWGGSAFSGSTAAIGSGAVLATASAAGVAGAAAVPGSGRAPVTSGPARPVTFEAVAYAGFGRRLGAAVTDAVLGVLVTALVVFVVGAFWFIALLSTREASSEEIVLTELALLVILGVVFWVYDAGLESSPAQATLGKRAVGVVVLDKCARRVSFARATARHFVKFIPLALGVLPLFLSVQALTSGVVNNVTVTFGIVGLAFLVIAAIEFVMIALTRQKRGLHDLIAGTVVVRRDMLSRVVMAPTGPPPPPPSIPEPRPGVPAGAARPAESYPLHR